MKIFRNPKNICMIHLRDYIFTNIKCQWDLIMRKKKIKMRFNVTMTRPTGNSCCSNHFITEVCPSTKHAIRGIVYTSEEYWRTSKCFNVYIVEDVTLII